MFVLCYQVIRSLESWEPTLSRQQLVDRIVYNYYTQGKFEELAALVRSLVEESVLVLASKSVGLAIRALAAMKNEPENVDVSFNLETGVSEVFFNTYSTCFPYRNTDNRLVSLD